MEWGVLSGKQRHFLQVQYADQLITDLLDHLHDQQMLKESLLIVVADHGISFALNDTRRALSSINKAALLRVPLFIKNPGQLQGQRIEQRAMTIDILPTILSSLGFSDQLLQFDGIDLSSTQAEQPRPRRANSYLDQELKILEESDLEIGDLVIENRSQLNLDDPERALWEIGPYDSYRGQPMEMVCKKTAADISVNYDKFTALPNTSPQKTLRAYVVGSFTGEAVLTESKPFLITNNGLIIASGNTWELHGQPNFFALVEPKYIMNKDWHPKAWLVEERQCIGEFE